MSTILINKETKEKLKEIGKKGQTYEEVINEIIELRNKRREIA